MKITEERLLEIGFIRYQDYDIPGYCYKYPNLGLSYYLKTLHYGALDQSTKIKTIEGVQMVIDTFKKMKGIK